MRNEVVLSIGMGPGQLDFIKRLKESGYSIIAFGKGKNSQEAVSLCDYTSEIDTRDFASAVAWIDTLPVKITAVGSYAGGAAVTTVQKLANYYGVCTSVPDELVVGSDKTAQQILYEKYALSSIKTWRAADINAEIVESLGECDYILKPAVGRGSEGISFLTKDKLKEKIGRLNNEDIIQVVRKGTEYRCVIIVQNTEIKLIAPILRKSYKDTVFLGILSYSENDIDRLGRFIESFVKKAGLRNTIIKADIIVSEKNIDVIEMDIGVGGGSYYKTFVSRVFGCELMDEYIKLITGQNIDKFEVKRPDLVMEYVYNHSSKPVHYELERCKSFYEKKYSYSEIQVNKLHPEGKGGYASNADFIFTVIHETKGEVITSEADELANKYLFSEEDQE